jgi:hypothetical protein
MATKNLQKNPMTTAKVALAVAVVAVAAGIVGVAAVLTVKTANRKSPMTTS